MAATIVAAVDCGSGTVSVLEVAGWGAAAVLPSGLAGWLCATVARRDAAAWPLVAAPGGLLALAAGLTAASFFLGPMPWDHSKLGPLLIAGLLVLCSGPTFLAGVWARWYGGRASGSTAAEGPALG
jgi:hypothetical protein